MKRFVAAALFSILLTATFSSLYAESPAFSKAQDEVWQREVLYWKLLNDGDIDGYMALWHPDFEGWPSYAKVPGDKDLIRKSTGAGMKIRNPGTVEYQLTPYSVNFVGDTASTFYRFVYQFTTKKGALVVGGGRIIHTWMKKDGKWVIVSGMSSVP